MQIIEITNLQSSIDDAVIMSVEYVEGQTIGRLDGYAYRASDVVSPLAPLIADWLSNNEYEIAPYAAAPVIELAPDEISRRQFFQQLAVLEIITKAEALAALQTGAIPTPLQGIIDLLPTEDDKFNAQMLVIGASTFNRTHPLAEIVRQAMQWTVEQKDEFWRDASSL